MTAATTGAGPAPRLPAYRGLWLLTGACLALSLVWVFQGRALARRRLFAPAAAPEAARTESQFLAVLFPRITSDGQKYTMSSRDLNRVLKSLRKEGYVSIGLRDVLDLYADRRRLPPKAVVLGFARDYPESVWLADQALERSRMRGVLFMDRAGSGLLEQRRHLSEHAVSQMLKGGAWDLGWDPRDGAPTDAERRVVGAWLLSAAEARAGDRGEGQGLRFTASQLGHNDLRDDPAGLRMLDLAAHTSSDQALQVIRDAWPRTAEFSDDFESGELGPEWVPGWGYAAARNGRLALIATPGHTGAAAFLRGTEKWRDLVVEFGLQRYQQEAWVYARYREDGGFVRAGVRNGAWFLEENRGPGAKTSMLGTAPMAQGSLPARVRVALKGDWAIMHVNGRMLFGKALRLDPGVDYGRLQFEAYSPRLRSARAFLTYIRARPAAGDWIALKPDAYPDRILDGLREAAAVSAGISPRWLSVRSDGRVSVDAPERDFMGSLAGFYRCRLAPMAELPGGVPAAGAAAESAVRALAGFAASAEAAGLNLRLRGPQAGAPEAASFAARLRGELRRGRRRLWVTLDGPGAPAEALARSLADVSDGVLLSSGAGPNGIEKLSAADPRAALGTGADQ